jgi:hypothetical protein
MSQAWTNDDCEKLKALVKAGVSPSRAGVTLGRSTLIVRRRARELGCSFPHLHDLRRKLAGTTLNIR